MQIENTVVIIREYNYVLSIMAIACFSYRLPWCLAVITKQVLISHSLISKVTSPLLHCHSNRDLLHFNKHCLSWTQQHFKYLHIPVKLSGRFGGRKQIQRWLEKKSPVPCWLLTVWCRIQLIHCIKIMLVIKMVWEVLYSIWDIAYYWNMAL